MPGTTYVFVSNHQSIYDTPVIFASVPAQLRIIAKESLARFPVLGWHLRRGGHLFVDRRHPDPAGILRRWRALVSEGLSLLIYAEGTRSRDGHVARFKGGSFLLAIQAGLPIVPLSVIGTRQVMPKDRLRTEPADVTPDHPRSRFSRRRSMRRRRAMPRRSPNGSTRLFSADDPWNAGSSHRVDAIRERFRISSRRRGDRRRLNRIVHDELTSAGSVRSRPFGIT